MVDRLDPEARGRLMAAVRSKDTKPEMVVRRLLHAMGYRFRLHRRDLPGMPDLVLPGRSKAIMVHGCFWHGHGCPAGRLPKSRLEFWRPKIAGNRARDARNIRALRRSGWSVSVIWTCQMGDLQRLEKRLRRFLTSGMGLSRDGA
jgi:DNA mismatch endonuclease (patch repair protein)